jgi:hypothetical protein
MKIGNRFETRMTQAQLGVIAHTEVVTKDELELCLRMIDVTYAPMVARGPSTTGEPIVAGSRSRMSEVAEYWAGRVKLLQDMSRTTEIECVLRDTDLHPWTRKMLERVGVRIA